MVPLIFKNDFQKEIDLFWSYINNDNDLFHKTLIFNYFSKLKGELDTAVDDNCRKGIIYNYISNFRNRKKDIIEQIEVEQKNRLETYGNIVLEKLSKLMDYTFDINHKGYVAVPVVLPFSPFNGNTFFYSILSLIKDPSSTTNDVVSILAHEAAHFILFDILKDRIKGEEYSLNSVELYFLKEILVVVLLKDATFSDILNALEYKGNTIIKYLNVENDNLAQPISDYFENLYKEYRLENKSFDEFLKMMIIKIKSISSELSLKWEMWNKYGGNINNLPKEKEEYQEPIVLK